MNPLSSLVVIMMIANVGGGYFFNSLDPISPTWGLKDPFAEAQDMIDLLVENFKDMTTDAKSEIFQMAGVNESSPLNISTIIDVLLALPEHYIFTLLEMLANLITGFFRSLLAVGVTANIWVDNLVYDLMLKELISESGDMTSDEISQDPVWMTWILIKAIIVIIFWFLIIRFGMQLLDIWKLILDIIPVV